ncbi:MAG TPA: hypothetical protein VFR85_12730 [Anaeromyxobacteraceae bacterium]|nr:hypothetical protein [Anaeromyxobacteraceae bacterium]
MGTTTRRLVACLWLAAATPAAPGEWAPPLRFGDGLRQMERLRRAGDELPQTLVLPERPGQNRIAWYEFDWRTYEVPPPGGGPGGIRLYHYRQERAVAERALPVIRNAFMRLVDRFRYSPTKAIPYILYSSKREFQSTNVFQVSESVLGVTSPQDLKMSLPYFGSQERFREVSTHELVHQFTVQKLLDIAGAGHLIGLVETLPLWFVEGLAEYYAHGGLDPETEVYLRDLVWNPDPERRHEVVGFAEDRLRGYLPTYKLGQARLAFVAEVYGEDRIQSFIENAPQMGSAGSASGAERGFAALVRRVLGEDLGKVDARWRAWMKRRYYTEYLRARQDLAQIRPIPDAPDEIESYAVSPDGSTALTRQIDRGQGRARLYLLDPRWPQAALQVAGDNRPGVESLHPIDQSILAVGDGVLAFAAQDGPTDTVYVQAFRRSPPDSPKPAVLQLGARERVAVKHPAGGRFIEISDLAFSPDARQLAFVALTDDGQRDVWVAPVAGGAARQVTDDPWDERDLVWTRDGILCASDATDHGRFNLFRLDPASGARTRLTTEPADDRHPAPMADGTVVFSSTRAGKPDLYQLSAQGVRRLTDFTTGLWGPGRTVPGRGLLAQTFYRGRFRLVEVPRAALLDEPPVPEAPPPAPPLPIPADPFPEEIPAYDYARLSNWKAETGFVGAAAAPGAYGARAAVLFADLLRDRLVLVDLAIVNKIDYSQGQILYQDRSGRRPWVLGLSHFVNPQYDRLDPNFSYYQREFGVSGALLFPLNRYQRVDLELTLGGINRNCLTDESPYVSLLVVCGGPQPRDRPGGTPSPYYPTYADWLALNGGLNGLVAPTVRYGYDDVRIDRYTGPIDGRSLLLELGVLWVPNRAAVSGFARADLGWWVRLVDRANFMFRLAVGTSFAPDEAGRAWARTWWLSAPDNLRGFYPLDLAWLVGTNYWVYNAELQIPLDWMVNFFIFDYLEGVAAIDFGGVFNRWSTGRDPTTGEPLRDPATGYWLEPGAWEARTLTGVLGVNMVFGPLLLRLHFGHPFDIGGQVTPALYYHSSWVTNFTMRWLFF